MWNLRVTVRVEDSDRQQIEKLVKEGRFKNISEVIRAALKEFLKDTRGHTTTATRCSLATTATTEQMPSDYVPPTKPRKNAFLRQKGA